MASKEIAVSLKIDSNLKRGADALFTELGLDLNTAITIFLRQSVRDQEIPFRVGITPFRTESIEETLERVTEELVF